MRKSDNIWQIEFHKRFKEASERCHLQLDVSYLVGVSGGADSVALAHWLFSQHYTIAVAHFHHGARQAADGDSAVVESFARSLGVPFRQGYRDVPAMARDNGWSFEEAARIARYRFLFSAADSMGCGGVVVAHTADDQVETVLMHILRGAGVAGLTGMRFREQMPIWHPNFPLLRPFLNQWREDVERYCLEYGLAYVNDESNADQTFFRNRLRHTLIPHLTTYNAGVKEHFWQAADILKDNESIVTQAVNQVWQKVIETEQEGLVVLNHGAYALASPALQRYLLRRIVQELYPELRDFGFEMTRSIASTIAEQDRDGCWTLFDDCLLMRYVSRVILGREDAVYRYMGERFPQWRHPAIKIDTQSKGSLDLGDGWSLTYGEYPMDDRLRETSPWLLPDPHEAWFDADQLVKPIELRHFEAGDRFQPFGMDGKHMKISDYLVNSKIPQLMREFFPLICDRQEILWVVGRRRSEKSLVGPNSTNIMHFHLGRED